MMGRFKDALLKEVGSYDDTEWTGTLGDTQVTLTSQPLTSADYTVIGKRHPNFAQAPTLEGMVDMLIRKCKDEHDNPAFDKSDKPLLMRVGTNKIGDIFGDLFGGQMDEYTDEDAEDDIKN